MLKRNALILFLGVSCSHCAMSSPPDFSGLADPTRPFGWQASSVAAAKSGRPQVVVDGIFFSAGLKHARINGQALSEGDSITGIHLLQVERHQVTLGWKNEIWKQELGQSVSVRR
jgi:hypothetical protein